MKINRNSFCACGSSKKYKKCCLLNEEEKILINEEFFLSHPELHKEFTEVTMLMDADKFDEAREGIQNLYDKVPNADLLNFYKGILAGHDKNFSEAIVYFDKTVKINPHIAFAYYMLGIAYLEEGKIFDANVHLKKVIEMEGFNGPLGQDASKILNDINKMILETEGLTLDEYAEQTEMLVRAFVLLDAKRFDYAISLFSYIIMKSPNRAPAYHGLALAHSAQGEKELALTHINKAIALDPNYEPAKISLAKISKLDENEKLDFSVDSIRPAQL